MKPTQEQGKILLVEDEESLRSVLLLNLEMEGYAVDCAVTGTEALDKGRSGAYDLCILDIMLPGKDGFEVCRTLRAAQNKMPILFLSARATGEDRVRGLQIGGDDYLTKPFNLEELLLRVKILIRHTSGSTAALESLYEFSAGKIYFERYEASDRDGHLHSLSKREVSLLKLLTSRAGEAVSRDEIISRIWSDEEMHSSRSIDNYILGFRKMFERSNKSPEHFHSIRGVGYKFTP